MNTFSNPLRWNCQQTGCFNDLARPKIEIFSKCFPGFVCMGDIDGVVEVSGRTLVMEWKRYPKALARGQMRMFDRWLEIPGQLFTILCVAGNASTMQVTHTMQYKGAGSEWVAHDLEWVFRYKTAWALWARKQRRITWTLERP